MILNKHYNVPEEADVLSPWLLHTDEVMHVLLGQQLPRCGKPGRQFMASEGKRLPSYGTTIVINSFLIPHGEALRE